MKKKEIDSVDNIDTEETINKIDYKKKIESSHFYKFIKVFFINLKENKLYMLSFIITLVFFGFASVSKVRDSEGFYNPTGKKKTTLNSEVVQSVDETSEDTTAIMNNKDKSKDKDSVDVTDYIGIYSRVVKLDYSIYINDTCSIDSYKLIYQVKKDGSITKYVNNKCIGTYKIWNDTLKYSNSSGARYISAKNIKFFFEPDLKENNEVLYKVDDDITSLKVDKKTKDLELYFFDDNIVFMSHDNLYLVNENKISYNLGAIYKNNGGTPNIKRIYKSSTRYQFNFIVFDNGDNENSCYTDNDLADVNYYVYSVKYNSDDGSFGEAKLINTRYKKDGCDVYNQDIKELGE